MNTSQKVTAAAMALIITLTGSIVVTAPMTLSGFSPASSRGAARQLPVMHGLGQDSGPLAVASGIAREAGIIAPTTT